MRPENTVTAVAKKLSIAPLFSRRWFEVVCGKKSVELLKDYDVKMFSGLMIGNL
jgi:hypothetical protein